ncbi:MAG: tRNA (adenosine(37)-N6)-threonylcarbamoyltransferase complex transferase subunit TsaD [Gemmatimonadaceae bacterium]|nr:tRNA (adenosine(37)-N6)-threonylcarbamoyltransferase complex transferase subunit TsaD [Gemmatimonadaceae bacterium]
MRESLRVLALESSCDETSASVVSGTPQAPQLESLVILSQDVHRIFGGVVPEIASREHLTAVVPVTQQALTDAGRTWDDIDAIAVTHAPGLVGALLVGVSYAKALAAMLDKPLLGIHHMEGHLFATALEHPEAEPPFTALLISGGHTMLLDVPAWGSYRLLGATRDDAAGEAFDKTAKLLGLPYPGGKHIERLAAEGDPTRFKLPRPMLHGGQRVGDPDYYDVSFSGLKTAVLLAVRASDDLTRDTPHIARGFQDALIDTLVAKTIRAAKAHGRTRIVLGGGVACNKTLVAAMTTAAAAFRGTVYAPTPRLATDNAAMIGAAALYRYGICQRDGAELNAHSGLPLPGLLVDAPTTA